MAVQYSQGTIKPAETLNEERQAEFLQKSMKGLGTDERRIIQILVSHNNEQRQKLADKYKQMYGRDLTEHLKAELSGCFEDLVVALLVPSRKYDALNVKKALSRGDQQTIVEILCPRTNAEIALIKDVYKKDYEKDLSDEVESALSGDLKRIIVAQVTGNREEDVNIDEEKVKKDAQDIYDAGEGQIGTDESVFIKVLCMRSFNHLKRVFAEYKTVSGGKEILETVQSETSGTFSDALQAIVKYVNERPSYYAERLYKTMQGPGTDDSELIRLIVSHSEIDLADIKEKFLAMYNKSLVSMIEGDCSGDYKKLLCAIVQGGMSPP